MTPRPTTRRSTTRLLCLLAVAALFMAACGQKANVANVSAGGGFGSGDGGGFADDGFGGGSGGGFDDLGTDGGTTDSGDGGTTGGGGGVATGGGGTSGGTGGGGTGGGGGGTGGGGGGGGGGGDVPAGDRTGITDTEIRIGIHAPVTGAAPFPQSSFETGRQIYWDFVNDTEGGVFGRKVTVFFEDDKFDPRTARDVCKKMVEQNKVFLLVGGGGADQITACADYANSIGVPYLSAGVNEDGLAGVRAYFALSTTYSQQSPLIAQQIKKQFPGKKVGIAVADSGSFNDAQASITAEAQRQGLNVVYNERIPKAASAAEGLSIANAMRTAGAEVVYFLSSPVTFLNVSGAGAGQGYKPQYIGPGITSGLNTVATVGCQANGSVDKAIFYSPFPQLDAIDRLDPNYKPSYTKYSGGSNPDDVGIALWGLNKTLHQMFLTAGENMTRQSFVATLEGGKAFETGVYPTLQYSQKNHFGGSQVHVLQAECAGTNSRYKTVGTFVSGF